MVESIGIVSQLVHGKDGIFLSPDDHLHIAALFMGCAEDAPPVQRSAVPVISEQDTAERAIGIVRSLPYFVRWLKVNLLYRVRVVRGFLVPV